MSKILVVRTIDGEKIIKRFFPPFPSDLNEQIQFLAAEHSGVHVAPKDADENDPEFIGAKLNLLR